MTHYSRARAFAALLLVPLLAPSAGAVTSTIIASAGPLTNIWISQDLACQAAHTGDALYELYPPSTAPGDCGTFLLVDGALYAPNFAAHGTTATGAIGTYTAFTPVSQSAVSGDGSLGNPYTIVTVVDVGTTGIRITETDRYIVGDEFYSTNVTLLDSGAAPKDVIVWRAGDCYLGGSDLGYGAIDVAAQRVGCIENLGDSPPGRFEEWIARSPGSHARHNTYSNIWATIGAHTAFDDTCQCSSLLDNGAGLSWNLTLPLNQGVSVNHDLRFGIPAPTSCRSDGLVIVVDNTVVTLGHAQTSAVAHGGPLPPRGSDPAPPSPALQSQSAWVQQPTITTPIYVQATGIFGRCDVGVATNGSVSGMIAYGRAGLAELTIAQCATCPVLFHLEALDREIEARSNGTDASAVDACDVAQLDVPPTSWAHIFAFCQPALNAADLISTGGMAAPSISLPPNPVTLGLPDGVDRTLGGGRAAYEGAALNLTIKAGGHTVSVIVGRVHVEVPAKAQAPSVYAPNRACALPRLCS